MANPYISTTTIVVQNDRGTTFGVGTEVQVFGCCEKGLANTPRQWSDNDALFSEHGYGPGVSLAALLISAGAAVTFGRLPSTTVGTVTLDVTGVTGTSVVTVTGAPLDVLDASFSVQAGGTIGTEGIVISYSLDGGVTQEAPIQLLAATTFVIPTTGLTLNFAAGTLIASDAFAFTATEPTWATADLPACFNASKARAARFRVHAIPGTVDSSGAFAALSAEAGELYTELGRHTCIVASTRDTNTGETEADRNAAIRLWSDPLADERIALSAGHAPIVCPITNRQNRRPSMFAELHRFVQVDFTESLARVATGPLERGTRLTNDDGDVVEHDSRTTAGLASLDGANGRFMTLQTIDGRAGAYVAVPSVMHGAGASVNRLHTRCLIDAACELARDTLTDRRNDDLLVTEEGTLREDEAKSIEEQIGEAFERELISKGRISAFSVEADTSTVLGPADQIKVAISVVSKIYGERLLGTIRLARSIG